MLNMTLCRDRIVNRFWVGFLFETEYCAYVDSSPIIVNCSTIELVEINEEGAVLVYNWGKNMQAVPGITTMSRLS